MNNNSNKNITAFLPKQDIGHIAIRQILGKKVTMTKTEVMLKKVERGFGPRATVGATFVTL